MNLSKIIENIRTHCYKLVVIVIFTLAGCSSNGVPMMSSGISGAEGLPSDQLSFASFKDIPIPDHSTMNVNDTEIFGNYDKWFGRLSISSDSTHAETYDFFKIEMPNYGWNEVTKYRGDSSVLIFENGDRVAVIQIVNSGISSSSSSITISPKNN